MVRFKEYDQMLGGHIDIFLPGRPLVKRYPVANSEFNRLKNDLALGAGFGGIMLVRTRNNRLLCVNFKRVVRIRLIDDADEFPDSPVVESNQIDGYAGHSTEVYQALSDLASSDNIAVVSGSSADHALGLNLINAGGYFERVEELRSLIHDSVIHLADGSVDQYEVAEQSLSDLADLEWDNDTEIVEISASDDRFLSYYPLSMISLIDVPLNAYEAARRQFSGI